MAVDHAKTPPALRRSSPDPLYRQLSAHIEGEIRRGALSAGERIDSEDVLARRFRISRVTVRQAVQELVHKQLLVRKQGKGTFVTMPAVRHDLRRLHGLVGSLFAQAPNASMKLLRYELRAPPADIAAEMSLPRGGSALALERLYLIGSKPVMFAQDWLAPEVAAVPRAKADLISTEDMMREVGIRIAQARISIRAEPAGALAGRFLGVPARTPVLLLRRQAFGTDGIIKEIGRISFRSDSYELVCSSQELGDTERLFDIRGLGIRDSGRRLEPATKRGGRS